MNKSTAIFAIIVLVLITLIVGLPWWVKVLVSTLLFCLAPLALGTHSDTKEKALQEEVRLETESKKLKDRKKSDALQTEINQLLECNNILIASDVWMTREFGPFFMQLSKSLKTQGRSLSMPYMQFDYLSEKSSQRNQSSVKFAISRIEQLQKDNLLTIDSTDSKSSPQDAIKQTELTLLFSKANEGMSAGFVSYDKDQLIRARHLAQTHCSVHHICDIGSIISPVSKREN